MTLFVPQNSRGIVSPADGSLSLRQILIPIAHSPSSLSAIEYAVRAVYIAGQEVKITLLHVSDSEDMPKDWCSYYLSGRKTSQLPQGLPFTYNQLKQ